MLGSPHDKETTMSSMLKKITGYARTPEASRLAERARLAARDPANRRKLERLRERVTGGSRRPVA